MKTCKRRGFVFVILVVLAVSAATPANAGTPYYWDTNGTTAGAADTPTGTWGSNISWSTNSAGTAVTTHTTTSTDDLYFVAGPAANSGENSYTVTVTGTQNANSLIFQSSGAPTLSGTGTISLRGGGITVSQYAFGTTAPGAVTISAPISLQAAQSWTNNCSNPLTVTGNVTNGTSALTISGSGNTTVSGIIGNGSGSLTKIGTGILTLTAANSFTGGTTISAGTLQLGDGTSGHDGSLSATGGITNNAALIYNLGGSQSYSGSISGSGSLTKTGTGTLTLSATNNSYSAGIFVTAGTLAVTNTGALPGYGTASKVAVSNGATLNLTGWSSTAINALLSANGGNFASGSTLGIDTTSGGISHGNVITGSMGLTKVGSNTLTLTVANSYTGPTKVGSGTLSLSSGGALQGSTLIAPTAGSISFNSTVSPANFTFGGLGGSGSISLLNTASSPVSLTVGGNNSSTTYSGAMSGTGGSLTKAGNGTLTLTGSSTFSGGTTVAAGSLTMASSGSLSMTAGTTGKNLYVGNTGAAAMTIQDNASVTVGGELDVNHQNTRSNPSTLTLTGGSLSVTGATNIGQARMSADPSNTSAAFYQSGGTATLTGLVTVGYNGTATSLLDINGGTFSANGGLLVGGNQNNPNSGQGTGVVNVRGSGILNVAGSQGLSIGQDTTRATSGILNLSGGTLTVTGTGGITLGSGGGIGALSRSGGSMTVAGGLTVGGNATLLLDSTNASVATSFGGGLTHSGTGTLTGTLVIVPKTGNLDTSEAISFATTPGVTNGIVGPWAVVETSATTTTGDYLTVTGSNPYRLTRPNSNAYDANFASPGVNSLENVSGGTATVANNITVYAMKASSTASITSGKTLTLASGGLILNGGTVTGGTLAFGATPLIFAGSITSGTIASTISCTSGLVKFGPGTLVLNADNSTTLSGAVAINSGTLDIQRAGALGSGATTVAAGASLEIVGGSGGLAVGNVPVTINGTGVGGTGALRNLSGNNSWTGAITLGGNAQINTVGGMLTFTGHVVSSSNLTKSGVGTLVLNDDNSTSLTGPVTVAGGALRVEQSNALGVGDNFVSVTVNNGATVQFQGGISIPNVPFTLNGAGTMINGVVLGALDNLQGSNSCAGPITLAADSQVNVDTAADTLTLSGNIAGGFTLSKAGSGTLRLSGTGSSYTGTLTVLNGTLRVPTVNAAASVGPLGQAAAPVVLGSSGNLGVLAYSGTGSASTNRAFTLAPGGTGGFGVDQTAANLTLSGAIGGNGNLNKVGGGTVTLSGSTVYTGATTASAGTLAISGSGSINSSSGVLVASGASLQVTAGTTSTSQLPDSGNVTVSGGNLNFIGNGSNGSGSVSGGELVGALVLGLGQNNITSSRASGTGTTYTPYLRFASGPTFHMPGATVNYYSTNSQIQFQSNPPPLVGDIIGGYAYWNNADFAVRSTAAPYTVSGLSSYTTGSLASMSGTGTNAKPTSSSSFSTAKEINSLNLTGTLGVTMTGSGSLTLESGGLIVNTTTGTTVSGGTLRGSASGELDIHALSNAGISSNITDHDGPTALVKTGSGTIALSGTNTYSGRTIVTGGVLEITNVSALPDGASLTIGLDGSVVLDSDLATAIELSGLWFDSGGTVTTSSPSLLAGDLSSELMTPAVPLGRNNNTAPVPEPGTFVLILAAVVGLGLIQLRRTSGR